MKFEVDCLSEVPDEYLKNLSTTLASKIKLTKKKISVCLKKDKKLMSTWVTKLSLDPPKALPEEIMNIRNERKREFEMALIENPDAFIEFQTNSFLVQLSEVVRIERNKRIPIKKK